MTALQSSYSRATDKAILTDLVGALQVSKNNLRRDTFGDWNIVGSRGHAMTDGRDVYVYVPFGSAWRWEAAKRHLGFMTVTQDGDNEGILRLAGTPTAEQAAILRKALGLRFVPALSEEARSARVGRLFSPGKTASQAHFVALSDLQAP